MIKLAKRLIPNSPGQQELPTTELELSSRSDMEEQQPPPTTDRQPDGDDPRDRVPADSKNMMNLPLLSTVIKHLISLWKRDKSIQPELPTAQREPSAGFDIEGQQHLPTADRQPDDGDDPHDRVTVDNNNRTNLQSLPAVIGPCFTAITIGIALQSFQKLAPVPATFPLSCMAILLMFCAYWASINLQRHYPKASSFMGQVSIFFAIIPVVLVFPVDYRAKLIFIGFFIFGGLAIKVLPRETGHRSALNIHPQPRFGGRVADSEIKVSRCFTV